MKPSEAAVEWVKKEPDRAEFLTHFVPDLDYEVPGGTEEALWAYEQHPWYKALGITREEMDRFREERNKRDER